MRAEIERLFSGKPSQYTDKDFELFQRFKDALNCGAVRAAEPDPAAKSGWRVNEWVKKGVLVGFRMGAVVDMSIDRARQPMFDKATWPVKQLTPESGVRIVPGGSSIRDGCYIGKGVTCMPPMYINTGTWVGDGTMVDSHALIGGNCGVYEGSIVKARAVLGSGVILTRSTPVYDVARGEIYSACDDEPLVIPEDAVVVAGSRAIARGRGKEWGISLYTPVIVKYRDSKTDARVQLEDLLR
jgi:2,3,4,5-tetrahydropyridine-2,6-dicarboxylate N-succinyltransferase